MRRNIKYINNNYPANLTIQNRMIYVLDHKKIIYTLMRRKYKFTNNNCRQFLFVLFNTKYDPNYQRPQVIS